MSRLRLIALASALAAGVAATATADELVLVSGATKTGVIVEETESLVRLQTPLGITGIGREFIAEIRRATPEANAAILAGWRADAETAASERAARRAERDAAGASERAYTEAQRGKGLVRYDDEWMTPREADLRLQQEQQTLDAANDRRVRDMEAEVHRQEQRSIEAQAQADGLDQELANMQQLLHDRDADMTELEKRIEECKVDRLRTMESYARQIFRLQRQLGDCRAHCPNVP